MEDGELASLIAAFISRSFRKGKSDFSCFIRVWCLLVTVISVCGLTTGHPTMIYLF